MRSSLRYTLPMILAVSPAALFAQWLGYPTSGGPRTPDGKPNLEAPAPRTADGKPDFSGMWGWVNIGKPCGAACTDTQISREFINIAATLKDPLPYRPWAAELVKVRRVQQGLDPNVHCMPRGAPRIWTDDYYKRIFQVPGRVIILTERNMQYRQIFTDGRPMPVDPQPSWTGYSTGSWQGDTLVVHTAGLRDGQWLDRNGSPLTDAAQVTERFHRIDYGRMDIEVAVNDPKAYTRPWTVTLHQVLAPDTDLIDYICLENEKDRKHLVK